MIVKKCRICSNKLLNIINFNQVALSGSFLEKRQVKNEKKYSFRATPRDYFRNMLKTK